MNSNVQQLEQLLEYTFSDQYLLVQAVTHPSYLHEINGKTGDYQRLEFLGDAVLGMLLAEMLYVRHPDWDEGALSQLRSRLAGQDVLADRARSLGIGSFFLLGRGEESTAGREKDSILADILEAIIASMYIDGGLQVARAFVERLFEEVAEKPELLILGRDSKSELQEYLSSLDQLPPVYRLAEESGPAHDRLFRFCIYIDDKCVGEGQGKSKKIAQQAAAADTLKILRKTAGQGV
ncbi:MAG: ribonuclease III [Desulfuromonadaceae bacterium]|nr:ribonuclease III [Desulfuromonadaceae bacterium]